MISLKKLDMINNGKGMIRNRYSDIGINEYYANHASEYYNPHEPIIIDHVHYLVNGGFVSTDETVLDFCCGTGEVTSPLLEIGVNNVIGCDPYMHDQYQHKTGKQCYTYSFKDVVSSKFNIQVDTIICSFALHLCSDSLMNLLCYNLARSCNKLIIITPNKKPEISSHWFELQHERLHKRVRSRVYKSIIKPNYRLSL